ncbi:MAG TPA: hypothetical protein VHP11_16755, partial [Tepidisphaeraceae bacterium]|nr:hypothetical protein [Tepidisphaeraceae bacterium]
SGPSPTTPSSPIAQAPGTPPPVSYSGSASYAVLYPANPGQVTPHEVVVVTTPPSNPVGPLAANVSNESSAIGGQALFFVARDYAPLGTDLSQWVEQGTYAVPQTYVRVDQGRSFSSNDTLQGYGVARVATLDHNGRVIADGFGDRQTLDLSQVSVIENSIDNPSHRGVNGWFAQNKGKLKLPALDVMPGTGTYTWGEQDDDPTIDLVNSVRVRLTDVAAETPVTISLLSLDQAGSDGVPALPLGHTFIGLWEFNAPDLVAGGIDLTVRYDDVLAREKNLNEMSIKMWRYEDGQWQIIQPFPQDPGAHLVSGQTDSLTYFAVSSPEPAGMLIFATSVLFLARRRGRRERMQG